MRNTVQGIKNLFYWLPIIWKDRNWDGYYIYAILQHKLKAQAKEIGTKDRYTRSQIDTRNMNICIRLIEKLKEEDYQIEYLDYEVSEFVFTDSEVEGFKELNIVEHSETLDDYFEKYKRVYQKIKKAHPDASKRVIGMRMGQENHERAKRLLYKIMHEELEGWWD